MPSTSAKQARLMSACAHGAGYASCPPMTVSTEFNQADAGTGRLKVAMVLLHRKHKGRVTVTSPHSR